MRSHPWMTLLVISAFMIGIGVNSAVFSVVNSVLLRPLPYADPEKLVIAVARTEQLPVMSVSYPDYLDWKSQCRSFQSMAVARRVNFSLSGSGLPERLPGFWVSSSYFTVLGVPVMSGRDFSPQDDRYGAERVAIISSGFWERRFAKDPRIVGKSLTMDANSFTVVGIVPSRIVGTGDVWVPIGLFADDALMNRASRNLLYVLARLAPATGISQAQAELEVVAGKIAVEYPVTNKGIRANVTRLGDWGTLESRRPLFLILAASFSILLLACVNVTTVFLASTVERRHELAVLLALGVQRGRLFRQLLLQSLCYAASGAALGIFANWVGTSLLVRAFPDIIFRFKDTHLDASVLGFTAATAFIVTLLAGSLPGLYAIRVDARSALNDQSTTATFSRSRSATYGSLIILEIAFATALSLVSGLLLKSFHNVTTVDLGFNPSHILSFQISLPGAKYATNGRVSQFYQEVVQQLANVPGVRSVSEVSDVPLLGIYHYISIDVPGHDHGTGAERPLADILVVTPGYFRMLHIPVMSGRDFTATDQEATSLVAIVDDELAQQMWPGQSPLGNRIKLGDDKPDKPAPWLEVVGVVRHVKQYGPEETSRMQVYVPLPQRPAASMAVLVDFTTYQGAMKPAIQKAVYAVDKDLPLYEFHTLEELFSLSVASRRLSFVLLASFAGTGVVLSAIGIYGIVKNSVARRRRELAIRLALGSTPGKLLWTVIGRACLCALAGIALGAAFLFALRGVISGFLFGVDVLDRSVYAAGAFMIIALCFVASLLPALRILRVDPQELLKG
jgi:putative ABC transport system permease protein